MALLEKLNQISLTEEQQQQAVIDEIVSYFRNYAESEKFLEDLEKWILTSPYSLIKREDVFKVRFWSYQSGCSNTYFQMGPHLWENPENPTGWNSKKYKNIELHSIQEKICEALYNIFVSKLEQEGFTYSCKRGDSCLNYYELNIIVHW